MSNVGSVILKLVSDGLDQLARDVENTSQLNVSAIEEHKKTLSKFRSQIEKWQDDVSHYSEKDKEDNKKQFGSDLDRVRNKFVSVQELIRKKSLLKDWVERVKVIKEIVSFYNMIVPLINIALVFFGFPTLPTLDSLLPAPAQKAIEHSKRTIGSPLFDKTFHPR